MITNKALLLGDEQGERDKREKREAGALFWFRLKVLRKIMERATTTDEQRCNSSRLDWESYFVKTQRERSKWRQTNQPN